MLLEFKCSNHKSIKETVTFSMIAGNDNTYADLLKEFGNFKILRSAVIYGANGSGKSNFINALAFMRNLVVHSINNQPGQVVTQLRHKLSEENTPSEYYIYFVRNDLRFIYGFSVNDNLISKEYLYYFPNGRKVKVFERNGIVITPGGRYKNKFEVSNNILKENMLFLSCAANYSDVAEIKEAFMFFKADMVIYNSQIDDYNWTAYSINLIQNNEEIKKIFIEMLQELGIRVKDVKAKLEKIKFADLPKEVQVPEVVKRLVGDQEEGNKIEAQMVYDKFETSLMGEESEGVQRLFQMICPILDILTQGRILICDELERSLHEYVISRIIELFQYSPKDKFAQLIFSTHNTNLLDLDFFRRDQVWFTQLNQLGATRLYPLAEIKNVRKSENLGKRYISGKYGAIPILNKNFREKLDKILMIYETVKKDDN